MNLKNKVDSQRITQSKQKKYRAIRTTNKLKVSKQCSSTSKVKGNNKRRYSTAKFIEFVLKTFVGKIYNDLYGCTRKDWIKCRSIIAHLGTKHIPFCVNST